MTKPITALMQKDMTRKEFLVTMGLGAASLFGFSTIVQLLTGKSIASPVQLQQQQSNRGYGASRYGI